MAVTTGGETADFGGRKCCGCASSCGGGHKAKRARGCGCSSYCHGCYGSVSYGCSAPVSYGCYGSVGYGCSAPVSYAAPISYGCYGSVSYGGCGSYSAPISYSGCGVGVGCSSGGVVYGGAVSQGGVVLSSEGNTSGTEVAGGSSSTTDNASTTDTGKDKDSAATTEDDKLKPGSTVSAEEQKWLKEMLAAEKDASEKRKLEDDFKKDSRVGRKATYEVFKKQKSGNKDEARAFSTSATIVVTLPAAARLTIDGDVTTSTSNVRTFVSPTLPSGKTYVYTMQAEYQHKGQPVTITKKVSVKAGKTSRVDLSDAGTTVASK